MTTSHPTLADLVFPSASEQPNLNTLLTDLKRANLSISNRLRSILQDADFVRRVGLALGGHDAHGVSVEQIDVTTVNTKLGEVAVEDDSTPVPTKSGDDVQEKRIRRPLVANERCGSWYVRPSEKGASAYFKSTDGHANAWKFSTRRLNLHLLEVIGKHDGCIIIDSTRRGKRMPDALSKTIPVWCAVVNRALFPALPSDPYHSLFTPPQVVSPSEHAQISALLPSFLKSLQALDLDLPSLRSKISKPLRPFWVTPDTDLDGFLDEGGAGIIFDDFHPVICCTASRRVAGGELTTMGSSAREGGSYVYVQGAGDDTENWACGLTAELWWANVETLLSTDEGELPDLVRGLVEETEAKSLESGGGSVQATVLAPGVAVCTLAQVGSLAGAEGSQKDVSQANTFRIALLPTVTPQETWAICPSEMQVGLGRHKVASRNLRPALSDICAAASGFFEQRLGGDSKPKGGARVVVACESGRDLSVAVALAVSIWCFDNDGKYRAANARTIFTKDMVKVRLGGIMTAFPAANPGRASLQSVNSFLMDYRR